MEMTFIDIHTDRQTLTKKTVQYQEPYVVLGFYNLRNNLHHYHSAAYLRHIFCTSLYHHNDIRGSRIFFFGANISHNCAHT